MSEVSFNVTIYRLVLGNQDATTGHYKRGYTLLSGDMVIFPPGTGVNISGHGIYAGRDSVGITNLQIYEGDCIKDSQSIIYRVVGVKPHTWGDTFVFYSVALKEILALDLLVPESGTSPSGDPNFFGFESITSGTVEFESGFERGFFV